MGNLLSDLPRGDPSKELKEHSKPLSQWADEDEAITNWMSYDKDAGSQILLGEVNGQLAGLKDDRHIVTVAGSRAG